MGDRLVVEHGGHIWRVQAIGMRDDKLYAMPIEEHEGWVVLDRTSHSGKQLFQCKTCGVVSVAPNKICVTGKMIDLTDMLVYEPLKAYDSESKEESGRRDN